MNRKTAKMFFALGILTGALSLSARPPVVVIPDEPTAVEKSAAAELACELGKCLGNRLIVVCERASRKGPMLYVGATKASKAARGDRTSKTDGVFLKSVEGGVVLDGEPTRAPIYAVDLYLEKYCGVRWCTSDAAHYPQLTDAPVENISLEYAPQFKYRETTDPDNINRCFEKLRKGGSKKGTADSGAAIQLMPIK